MAEKVGYYLTESDRAAIRELIDHRIRSYLGGFSDSVPPGSAGIYVARVEDDAIPALTPKGEDTYDHPGVAVCEVYQILPSVTEGEDWDLTPVSNYKLPVFNLTESELPTDQWLLVHRTKQGLFVASPGASLPSGTTLNDILYWNPEEETWVVLPSPCSGTGSGSCGTTNYVLVIIEGTLQWAEVEEFVCPSGTGTV